MPVNLNLPETEPFRISDSTGRAIRDAGAIQQLRMTGDKLNADRRKKELAAGSKTPEEYAENLANDGLFDESFKVKKDIDAQRQIELGQSKEMLSALKQRASIVTDQPGWDELRQQMIKAKLGTEENMPADWLNGGKQSRDQFVIGVDKTNERIDKELDRKFKKSESKLDRKSKEQIARLNRVAKATGKKPLVDKFEDKDGNVHSMQAVLAEYKQDQNVMDEFENGCKINMAQAFILMVLGRIKLQAT